MSNFPYFTENDYFEFPDPHSADENGVVGYGGNLSPGLILSAYKQGIFPWFNVDDPILWWSPDPRFILFPEKIHVSRSMQKVLKKNQFTFSVDKAFQNVIQNCSSVVRENQAGTWITDGMINAYTKLHELGYAHSIEVWYEEKLVGGFYGLNLGNLFFGESMFSLVPNASKAGFIKFTQLAEAKGIGLIDCQVYTSHLYSLGAENISRKSYLELLAKGLEAETWKGSWTTLLELNDEC